MGEEDASNETVQRRRRWVQYADITGCLLAYGSASLLYMVHQSKLMAPFATWLGGSYFLHTAVERGFGQDLDFVPKVTSYDLWLNEVMGSALVALGGTIAHRHRPTLYVTGSTVVLGLALTAGYTSAAYRDGVLLWKK